MTERYEARRNGKAYHWHIWDNVYKRKVLGWNRIPEEKARDLVKRMNKGA